MREDIKNAIKEYEIATTPFFKRSVEAAEKYLDDSENVILCLEVNFCINYPDPTKKIALPGIVLITNKRIIIYYKPNKEEFTDVLPLEDITNIKPFNPLVGSDHIQVYSVGKVYDFPIVTKQRGLVISAVQSKQAAFAKIYRAFLFAVNPNCFGETKTEGAEKCTDKTSDIPEQIEKLAALKEKGIISEEEFQTKKSELLARL